MVRRLTNRHFSQQSYCGPYNKDKAAPDQMVQGGPDRPALAALVRRGAEPGQFTLG